MVTPLGKVLIQVAVVGTQIVGRAFAEAYRQAAANAPRAASAAAKQAGDKGTRQTGMTLSEAAKILNVTEKAQKPLIQSQYAMLFEANDPKQGGSFYLQSKVYRAKERFDVEHGIGTQEQSGSAQASNTRSNSEEGR